MPAKMHLKLVAGRHKPAKETMKPTGGQEGRGHGRGLPALLAGTWSEKHLLKTLEDCEPLAGSWIFLAKQLLESTVLSVHPERSQHSHFPKAFGGFAAPLSFPETSTESKGRNAANQED